jgi:hypothetical protein
MSKMKSFTIASSLKPRASSLLFLLFCSIFFSESFAQENIPLGTWRAHLSFNSIDYLAAGGAEIFAASDNGVLKYDLEDGSFTTYSTMNALSATGISTLAYDESRKQLIVGYKNGNLDLIGENASINFTRLVNPPDISALPQINHILVKGSVAYLSTNYGIVVYDLTRNEVRESWRNLGSAGQLLAISTTTIKNDSIFAASGKGVLAGKLTDNLLDFAKWTRYETGDFNSSVKAVSLVRGKIFAAINGKGIYQFTGSGWTKNAILPVAVQYKFLRGDEGVLLLGGDQRVWQTTDFNTVTEITDPLITIGNDALSVNAKIWLADEHAGLLSDQSGMWTSYLANGPASSYVFKTKFVNNNIVTTHGGFTSTFQQGDGLKTISRFDRGLWSSLPTQLGYLSDVEEGKQQSLYIASFGEGLERMNADGTNTVFTNSLQYVTDIENTPVGLWVANYGSINSHQLLKPDDTWQTFSHPSAAYTFKLAVDFSGNVWSLQAKNRGGGVFIMKKDGTVLRYLTDQPNGGLLPSEEVLSIAVDNDGYVWIGTAKGVCYYTFAGEDAVRPLVDGRFLLSEERVTAIAVDGGNRKWMGTERGLWLFDNNGETTIHNFTTENSPLPSNVITDIEINGTTGEVFISTDKGLISFRADATKDENVFSKLKIFPNPVAENFTGLVGISGLYANAVVKITDTSGKLVNQVQANGGTASWNVTDYQGKRVNTGVYIVIASAQDGSESVAGKIVVID